MHIIELFAGVGGLSLGAARAGFKIAAAVELDKHAISSHAKNFPTSKHFCLDVGQIDGKELLKMSGLNEGELTGLIGGPPCQGFSTMGKRVVCDPRNNLFVNFFRIISETQPTFFLAENVPGIMNAQYDIIRNEAFSYISKDYEILPPIVVKANEFGAPTTRKRIFFIGFKKHQGISASEKHFSPSDTTDKITVKRALDGLPLDFDNIDHEGWVSVKKPKGLTDFESRLCGHIPEGVGNPEAIERYVKFSQVSGFMPTKHSASVEARYAALTAKEQDKVSKSSRLDADSFCPTLRAGTGSDKGSFQAVRPIHYARPRVITPREAARLQGFPDWFIFHSTKWHSFRQIGNSVSPIVAEEILSKIKNILIK